MANNEKIGSEPERGRAFYPNDNAQDLSTIDWKSRYQELKNRKDWDPEKQFAGIQRLGDRYHLLDPFFKFDGTPDHLRTFDKGFLPAVIGFGSLVSSIITNYWTRRPLISALPVHFAATVVGVGVGIYFREQQARRARERDSVLIHYMLLHEKDLPMIERKKFGQVTRKWYPFRVGTDGLLVKE